MSQAYIPYATQSIDEADLQAVRDALTSGWLTQGAAVPAFEAAFAGIHGVDHAVAVCNATAGLHLACLALGVGPGDRVWTTPNSFVASANCALYCGAQVDFVDIDRATRNMGVQVLREKLERSRRDGTLPKVVVAVHFAGLPCDLQQMRALADDYGFAILADASHAVGAAYQGRPVASRFADVSVFSFHPVKIITTGEGGMLATQRRDLAHRLRLLRSHGVTRDAGEFENTSPGAWYYEQQLLGFNYRLTDFQAALGASQLARLAQFHEARVRIAAHYMDALKNLPLVLPVAGTEHEHAWHLYVVEIKPDARFDRAKVFEHLRKAGIGVNVHYMPIHLQPYYRRLGFHDGYCPQAEAYAQRCLSLPMYADLQAAQQDRVVEVLRSALQA